MRLHFAAAWRALLGRTAEPTARKVGRPHTLARYRDRPSIVRRIEVLSAKRDRVALYDASVAAGAPDVSLLDEKQLLAMRQLGCPEGAPFPGRVLRSMNRSIDILQSRLKRLDQLDEPRRLERAA